MANCPARSAGQNSCHVLELPANCQSGTPSEKPASTSAAAAPKRCQPAPNCRRKARAAAGLDCHDHELSPPRKQSNRINGARIRGQLSASADL